MSYRKTRVRSGQLYVSDDISIVVLKIAQKPSYWWVYLTYPFTGRTELATRSTRYLQNELAEYEVRHIR